MSEVKRYDIGCIYAGEDEMVKREDGDWVKYKDYAELKAQRDALAAENAALKLAIETHKHGFMRCECCGEENMCHNDDVCRALDETPAADAYLNSVRAEGVEMFAEWLRDQAITFDAHGRHGWADKNRMAADAAKRMSAQLRAGEPS